MARWLLFFVAPCDREEGFEEQGGGACDLEAGEGEGAKGDGDEEEADAASPYECVEGEEETTEGEGGRKSKKKPRRLEGDEKESQRSNRGVEGSYVGDSFFGVSRPGSLPPHKSCSSATHAEEGVHPFQDSPLPPLPLLGEAPQTPPDREEGSGKREEERVSKEPFAPPPAPENENCGERRQHKGQPCKTIRHHRKKGDSRLLVATVSEAFCFGWRRICESRLLGRSALSERGRGGGRGERID